MEASHDYAVQMHGIVKRFGAFTALSGVDLDVKKQSIHAILGENGAGKSTLMNILYGLYQADAGTIFLNGKEADITNPTKAIKHGIGMIHQHFMLVENFTVTENIVLGDEVCGPAGVLDMKRARAEVASIVEEYGFEVDPDARIEDITVGMQQRVEILKALYRGADTLILDEPTAVLTPQEIEQLIKIMRDLVSKGKTIIIITHKLKEIMSSADECTIIRRGVYMGTVDVSQVTEDELASKMVGRHVNLTVDKTPATPGDVVLSIRDLHVNNERGIEAVKGLNLEVRAGEIVGIAGIDGNGQKELVDAIDCLIKAQSGTVTVCGKDITNTTPRTVIDTSVSTVPSDRHRWGLVLPFSVSENMVLERHGEDSFGSGVMLDYAKIDEFTHKLIDEYDIRPANCEHSSAGGLSGGNQQKVIIARQVSSNPKLLIAVQPTRGLDVGAIEFVHKALIRERDRGCAILLISLELDEVMDVADTIAVIYDGAIVDTFAQGTITESEIGLLMAGGAK
ncbi:ABC transporter ATP-binding protein [Atopobium minutum]|uniref:Nucleoside ABC transporter ATP-binding protein n=1 Tax=Atopobium minutum TaxID=1381 RepID=A0AB38A6Y0_9ACTN|nr:ABC transporter ATP-binding protein [Atopobium minutum]SEB75838.1 nucleoside ABC transporter ATP-binding protein [Atopobium minutum]